MNFSFAENAKVVQSVVPAQYSTGALTTEWINMKGAHKATFIWQLGALGTASTAVTLGVAASAAGSKSTTTVASMDLPFDYYYISGTAGSSSSADVYTKVPVSASTFTLSSSSASKVIIIEVEASKLGQFTSSSATYDADYIRLNHTTGGADYHSLVCILTGVRYQEESPPTATG